MMTTETINVPREHHIFHKKPDEFGGEDDAKPNLLSIIAKQYGLTEDEAAKQLGIVNKNPKKTPERPQAECHQCGKTYAIQDKSCFEKQDVCPACRDTQAAPARELVHGREKATHDAQAARSAQVLSARKDEEDVRIAKIAAAVVAATKAK